MTAIILAAGYATRLYPLTLNKPKALLKIKDTPIIDYIVEELATLEEVTKIYVVTNQKFFQNFSDWAKENKHSKMLEVLNDHSTDEESRLGAIGDILFTIEESKIDDDVIIIASDNLFTYKLKELYDFYKQSGNDCVVVKQINDVELLRRCAVAKLDENNIVKELVEKPEQPTSDIAVFATYVYKRETLPLIKEYLEEGGKKDAPGYFVQWLHKVKDVSAYVMNGDCYDIGTVEAYNEVKDGITNGIKGRA